MGNQTFERPFIRVGEGDAGLTTFDDVNYAIRIIYATAETPGASVAAWSLPEAFTMQVVYPNYNPNKENPLYASLPWGRKVDVSKMVMDLINAFSVEPSRLFLYHNESLLSRDGILLTFIVGFDEKPTNIEKEIQYNIKLNFPIATELYHNDENIHLPAW